MGLLNRVFIIGVLVFSAHSNIHAMFNKGCCNNDTEKPLVLTQEREDQFFFDVLKRQGEHGCTGFMQAVLTSKPAVISVVCKMMKEKLSKAQIFEILSVPDSQGYTGLVLAVVYGRAEAIDAICQVMLKLSYDQRVKILKARGPVGFEPDRATADALERLFLGCGFLF